MTSLMPIRLNCIRPKRPYQTAETADENLGRQASWFTVTVCLGQCTTVVYNVQKCTEVYNLKGQSQQSQKDTCCGGRKGARKGARVHSCVEVAEALTTSCLCQRKTWNPHHKTKTEGFEGSFWFISSKAQGDTKRLLVFHVFPAFCFSIFSISLFNSARGMSLSSGTPAAVKIRLAVMMALSPCRIPILTQNGSMAQVAMGKRKMLFLQRKGATSLRTEMRPEQLTVPSLMMPAPIFAMQSALSGWPFSCTSFATTKRIGLKELKSCHPEVWLKTYM